MYILCLKLITWRGYRGDSRDYGKDSRGSSCGTQCLVVRGRGTIQKDGEGAAGEIRGNPEECGVAEERRLMKEGVISKVSFFRRPDEMSEGNGSTQWPVSVRD